MEAYWMPNQTQRLAGPAIYAVHAWEPGNPEKGARHQLLSDDERAQLATIATIVRFKKGERIYNEGDPAEAVFNIISGVVTGYRSARDGEHVTSFLYAGDLFGLTEEGNYSNATKAATAVVAYKMPLPALRRILNSNADLDVDVIMKLCEGLREAQRHALLLAQNRAATRLAIFLDMLEHLQAARGEPISEIYLPMDRSSIAAYLGVTLAALSRAFRLLSEKQIVSSRNRHHIKILDRHAFNRLIDITTVEDAKKTRARL
jgi:CRP/FNR family transcriptional regulator